MTSSTHAPAAAPGRYPFLDDHPPPGPLHAPRTDLGNAAHDLGNAANDLLYLAANMPEGHPARAVVLEHAAAVARLKGCCEKIRQALGALQAGGGGGGSGELLA